MIRAAQTSRLDINERRRRRLADRRSTYQARRARFARGRELQTRLLDISERLRRRLAEMRAIHEARRIRFARDREFLPAAIEIIETPPSPIKMGLLILICAFMTCALLWGSIGKIDIVAVAPGRMQPAGRIKVIQPLETSRVVRTLVENGSVVRAGDPLVELDANDALADKAESSKTLQAYRAEALRRAAAMTAARAADWRPALDLVWPSEVPAMIRRREELVYAADITQLCAQVTSLKAQLAGKKAELSRLSAMLAAQTNLIETLQARVDIRNQLLAQHLGSRTDLLTAQEALQTQQLSVAQFKGQQTETAAAIDVAEGELRRVVDTFIADNAQKRAEAERQADSAIEKLAKAAARLDKTILRSPIDGVVQASIITTAGQVVPSGSDVMRIVPQDAELEIEAYLPNKDIGFVAIGDRATVKIDAFPFTRYGALDATVVRVARDAIAAADADQAERNPTRLIAQTTPEGAQRTQNLVYPVTLRLARRFMNVDGHEVPLTAGMSVNSEITTGRRRMIDYLISPIVEAGSTAMKER
jgi:hemolysin D